MSKVSPIMTIFAGPNGAGKSTLRELLALEMNLGIEIDPDAIARKHDLSDLQAGRETINLVKQYIQQGVSFSLETTLSGNLILKQIQQAKEHGFQTKLIFVSLGSSDQHLDRVEQRVIEGGHHIAHDDVVRRYQRSHENLSKAISMVDTANVYNNAAKFEMVVRINRGEIVEHATKIPVWATPIINKFTHHPAIAAGNGVARRTQVCNSRCQTSAAPASKCRCVCNGKNHGIKRGR